MTENTVPLVDRSLPLHEQEAILSKDHNKGMHRTHATVRDVLEVTPQLVRVVAHIDGLSADPQWSRPNVSLRIHLEDGEERLSRVYTVRSVDIEAETIEIDVVRHGESSPMMRWLDRLHVGDDVPLVGPRPHFQIPADGGRDVAVFADATAIPALYSLLEHLDDGVTGRGWVATADHVAFDELPVLPGLPLERIDPGLGFTDQLSLFSAGADVVVWGAGERDEMRAVRSHFRNEVGVSKEDTAVYGYWKRGTTNTAIDEARLRAYEALLAEGGTVTDMDDLSLPI